MLKVVKIGGNVVDNSEKLDRFLQDFASLEGPKVLVHGGGKIATTIGKALGIETQMIGGRRVTDAETLKVVTMVYAGLINKTIVAKLRTAGCNAVGLCGADGSLLNTNADTVARTMAVGLSGTFETELVYCFEKRGVLMDVDDDRSVIPEITPARFAQLRADGIVADGMLPKLENAFDAIEHGVRSVAICSADAVAEKGYGGTTLKAD